MGLGFLVPALLGALVALGIPLWMHLRDRNEESPVRFPSLMFLVRLPIRSADRRRVTDIPLLILRALVVALLVMAFARPFVGEPAEVATGERARAVVLVLDRSLSMSHGATWAAAQDSALRVLDGLTGGDRVTVLLADEEATTALEWTADIGAARAAVQGAVPVPRGTRYGAALRAARGALATAPPAAREVVFVTDLQRSGLGATAGLEWPDGVALQTVIAAPARRANTSVSAVEVRRVAAGNRSTLSVQARIVARELDAPRNVSAVLSVAGRDVATRDVELPANGDRTVVFDGVPAPASAVAGLIRIDSDELSADDSLHFTLGADAEMRVLLLTPRDLARDETLFLERALAIGRAPAVRVERRPLSTFDATSLERASVVLLWDAVPTGAALASMTEWVAAGGGVVLHVAQRLGARRAPLLDAATSDGTSDRASSGGASIGETRADHALFLCAALLAPRAPHRAPRQRDHRALR
jgi:Mg-chelatase subunit ChlD